MKASAMPSGKAIVTMKKMPAYDEHTKVDVHGHRHFLQMMAHLLQTKEAGKTDGGKMAFRTMSERPTHTSEHSGGAKKNHPVWKGQGDAIEALALLLAHRQPGDFVWKASDGSKHELAVQHASGGKQGRAAIGSIRLPVMEVSEVRAKQGRAEIDSIRSPVMEASEVRAKQGRADIGSIRHKADGQVLAQSFKHPYAPGFAPDRINVRLSKPAPAHMAMNAPLTGVPSRGRSNGRDSVPAEAKPVRLNGEPIAANVKATTEKAFAASGRMIPAIADAIKSDESSRGSDFNRFGKPHNGEAAAWFSSGPMSKIQQLVLHGQSAPTRAIDLVEQVKAAVTKGNFKTLADGSMRLSIKLHPAHLGELQIVLVKNETGLDVTLIAHTEAAKKLLESQLGDLKQSFQTLGMNVHKIDIQQPNAAQAQSSGFSGYPDGHTGGGHGREQGDKKPPTGRDDQGDHDVGHAFDDWLTEGGSSS